MRAIALGLLLGALWGCADDPLTVASDGGLWPDWTLPGQSDIAAVPTDSPLPAICTAGTAFCLGPLQVQSCNPSGTAWSFTPCPPDTQCSDAVCSAPTCLAGERRCASTTTVKVCDPVTLTFLSESVCDPAWTCLDGACQPCPEGLCPLCLAGEALCLSDAIRQECNIEGSAWIDEACPDGTTCQAGSCLAALSCVPGERRCGGPASPETCNPEGTAYLPDEDCPLGTTCQEGACLAASSCLPGERRCASPTSYETCNPQGTAHLPDEDCPGGGLCADGVCQACVPGEAVCLNDRRRRVCDALGSWTIEPCPEGTHCQADACISLLCEPGSRRCVTDTSWEVCGQEGMDYDPPLECDPGWTCQEGTCFLCAPDQATCLDSFNRQVCDPTGAVLVEEPCPEGTYCRGEECVSQICEPGRLSCASLSSLRVCNDEGSGYDPLGECPAEAECAEGECLDPCGLAELNRSSIGCVYYAVDTNPIHSWIPGDFAVAMANTDTAFSAWVVIERKEGEAWVAVVDRFEVGPLQLQVRVLPHRFINGTALFHGGAYRITADLPIIAYQFNPLDGSQSYLSDASLLLPRSGMDQYHLVAQWPQGPADESSTSHPAHIQIVASAPTIVRVTSSIVTQAGGAIPALEPGVATDFPLEEGDFLQLSVARDRDSFTGTFISSTAPVGVFASNDCVNVPAEYCCCEHLEEQILGLQKWGKVYAATRVPQRASEPAIWQILAWEDDTTVTFDAAPEVTGLPPSMVLMAHEMEELRVNGPAHSPGDFMVTADKPVLVVQYMVGAFMVSSGGSQGDPAMVQAVPMEQYLDRYVVLVPGTWVNDIFILTREAGAEVLIDGVAVEAGWIPVGSRGYEVARAPVADGVHVLEGSRPFGIIVMGWDSFDSYAYPGGLNLQEINPYPDHP